MAYSVTKSAGMVPLEAEFLRAADPAGRPTSGKVSCLHSRPESPRERHPSWVAAHGMGMC